MAHRLQPVLDKILTAIYSQDKRLFELSKSEIIELADTAYLTYPEVCKQAQSLTSALKDRQFPHLLQKSRLDHT
jgi:hypothetical protein